MTWQSGRQLASINKDGLSATFAYDANGHRTQKTVNGVTTNYYWVGDRLQYIATGDDLIVFLYDDKGTPYGMFTVLDGVQQYFFYLYNAQGDVIAIIDDYAERVVNYEYSAWGELLSVTGSKADTVGVLNPFRYRGYCYDTETGLYLTGTRYYDPEIGRFINADGQLNDDIIGSNLFTYCGNNPITRADSTGQGWWIVAGAIIGGIVGGVTQAISNVSTGKKWNDGIIGAVVGGAVYGAIASATGNVWAAGFASAAAESLTNEVTSYIPTVSKYNGQTTTKKVTKKNVINSTKKVVSDTAVNGVTSAITGTVAGKIVPTNNGWFKPQKLISSFVGQYAIKSDLQTLVQSGLLFGFEGLKRSFNERSKQGQQPVITFFPDTEIRAAG